MSNGNYHQPKHGTKRFWLSYHAWLCAVNRWEEYMDDYTDAEACGNDDRQYVAELLMTEAANDGQFWESIVNSYWTLWRN